MKASQVWAEVYLGLNPISVESFRVSGGPAMADEVETACAGVALDMEAPGDGGESGPGEVRQGEDAGVHRGGHFAPFYRTLAGDVVGAGRHTVEAGGQNGDQVVFVEELHVGVGAGYGREQRLSEGVGYEVIGVGAQDGASAQDGDGR